MACEENLSICVGALVASLGAVVTALVALAKANIQGKDIEEMKKLV